MFDTNRALIRQFADLLIRKAGGIENAARMIALQMGVVPDATDLASRKGTISKRQHGQLGWPLDELMALEDALRDWPVRRWLTETMPEAAQSACVVTEAGEAAAEAGQAVAAALAFASGRGDRATAMREAREAHAALGDLVASLESDPS